jgi:drug/metabolite transporter (DMT)-like permease
MTQPQSPAPRGKMPGARSILLLQSVVVLYTLASASGKCAAGHALFSPGFFAFYALEIGLLGVYALLWQQLIKRFPLSVAYANRSVAILWSMVWAAAFFGETITPRNLAGAALILAGTWVVNRDESE